MTSHEPVAVALDRDDDRAVVQGHHGGVPGTSRKVEGCSALDIDELGRASGGAAGVGNDHSAGSEIGDRQVGELKDLLARQLNERRGAPCRSATCRPCEVPAVGTDVEGDRERRDCDQAERIVRLQRKGWHEWLDGTGPVKGDAEDAEIDVRPPASDDRRVRRSPVRRGSDRPHDIVELRDRLRVRPWLDGQSLDGGCCPVVGDVDDSSGSGPRNRRSSCDIDVCVHRPGNLDVDPWSELAEEAGLDHERARPTARRKLREEDPRDLRWARLGAVGTGRCLGGCDVDRAEHKCCRRDQRDECQRPNGGREDPGSSHRGQWTCMRWAALRATADAAV